MFVHVSKRLVGGAIDTAFEILSTLAGRKKDSRTRISSPGCDKLQGEEKKEILRRVRDKKIISVNQQVSKTGSQSRKFSLVFKIS